jgi:drug/metabolite transporter (DMT)-like permease
MVIGLGNLLGGSGIPAGEVRSIMVADLLLVGAVTSWGAYLTLCKPLISRYGALSVLAGTFLVGCMLEVPIALVTLPNWVPMLAQASTRAWISLGVLAFLITPANLALQNLSLRRLDASQVATFSNIAPILTVVWGIWFFHETLTPSLVFGAVLTLGGVISTSRPRASFKSMVATA